VDGKEPPPPADKAKPDAPKEKEEKKPRRQKSE
jgi:hypothetical protein